MVFETGILLFGVTSVAGVATWSLRQEGRINGHDKLFEEREKQLIAVQAQNYERHQDTKARLERIERKLDNLNGLSTR